MPSTTRGNLGEVIGPNSSLPTSPLENFSPASLSPFRPRPILVVPRKPPSRTLLRLQFITLPRRYPPHSSRAACVRYRLAKKKSPPQQFDNMTSVPDVVKQFEARARSLIAQLQQIYKLLDTVQKLHPYIIHTHLLASSSFPPSSTPNLTQHLVRTPQPGLAIRSTVVPPETGLCTLLLPLSPFPEDVIM
ncbi:hypothetical protein B0H10DRAFT_2228022 [Mycena sp. CBHHK59/15]|nr:hypothetical protein B0H10DRAFT_2228022 [Mycena sp. CBHHK59/15]